MSAPRPDLEGIEERIAAATKRITDGHGAMRIPADKTDPDLVLGECAALLAYVRELERALERQQKLTEDSIALVYAANTLVNRSRRFVSIVGDMPCICHLLDKPAGAKCPSCEAKELLNA